MSEPGDLEGGPPSLERIDRDLRRVRDEINDLSDAVARVGEVVDELGRRVTPRESEALQGERWQARLGGIETRLSMLEANIRSEVERVRAAAGVVDMVADEFRNTLGATRSLDDLARQISQQVDALASLMGAGTDRRPLVELAEDVNGLRAAVGAVAGQVHDQLALRLSESSRTTAAGIDELAVALGAAVTELRNAVSRGHDDTTARLSELGSGMDDIRTAVDGAVAPVTERIRTLAGTLDGVRDDVVALRDQPEVVLDLTPVLQRLAGLGTAIGMLRDLQPDLSPVLDRIDALPEPPALDLTPVLERLDALPAPPALDLTPVLERLDALPGPPPSTSRRYWNASTTNRRRPTSTSRPSSNDSTPSPGHPPSTSRRSSNASTTNRRHPTSTSPRSSTGSTPSPGHPTSTSPPSSNGSTPSPGQPRPTSPPSSNGSTRSHRRATST